MRILAFGDVHLRPYTEWSKGLDENGYTPYLDEAFASLQWVSRIVKSHHIDLTVNLGDTIHKSTVDPTVLKLLAICRPFLGDRILVGNHETYSADLGLDSAYALMLSHPVEGQKIYSAYNVERFGELVLGYTPTGATEEQVYGFTGDVLCTHVDWEGACTPTGFAMAGMKVENCQANVILAGHIHRPFIQEHGTTLLVGVGSLLSSSYNEVVPTADLMDLPGVVIYDTDTGEMTREENPYTSLYVAWEGEQLQELEVYLDSFGDRRSRLCVRATVPDKLATQAANFLSSYLPAPARFRVVSSVEKLDLPEPAEGPKGIDYADLLRKYAKDNCPAALDSAQVVERGLEILRDAEKGDSNGR